MSALAQYNREMARIRHAQRAEMLRNIWQTGKSAFVLGWLFAACVLLATART